MQLLSDNAPRLNRPVLHARSTSTCQRQGGHDVVACGLLEVGMNAAATRAFSRRGRARGCHGGCPPQPRAGARRADLRDRCCSLQVFASALQTPPTTSWGHPDRAQSKGLVVHCKNQVTQETVARTSGGKDEPIEMQEMVNNIRAALRSKGDGQISVSAYDTAWVALVKNQNGCGSPQFPSSIDWITENQLADGSWGDDLYFLVHDRILNTLACVIALTVWKIHDDKCEKGLSFIRENIWRLAQEEEAWTPVGLEVALPSLVEMAKDLALDMPYDDPALQKIYAQRELKLKKIPRDILHAVPTTLLHSIEGMQGLDWKRLLKLQCSDGSFMSSPAATAYVFMQTGDKKCLEFLDGIVEKFHRGVPFLYPIDIFERLWTVDRLDRLGISRYFKSEIDDCLEHAFRQWTQEGLGYTGHCSLKDIDISAMAFRLLRLHGYSVSPSAFKKFEKDGEFVCYSGELTKSVSATNNLYRAAQVIFPGDDNVIERAKSYCYEFLQERRAINKLNDKWVIADGLPSEIGYALDFPWKASLPRVETRMYLEQYGASRDVWIGKVLYRLPLVNNDLYLKMAKSDFNSFQRRCQLEWHGIKKWYARNNLEVYGVTPKSALRAYFVAAANIFEPNRAEERLGWARTAVLAEAISSRLRADAHSDDMRERLFTNLTSDNGCHNLARGEKVSREIGLMDTLDQLINSLASAYNSCECLRGAWRKWLMTWNSKRSHGLPEENTALLLVRTVEIISGRYGSNDRKLNLEYSQIEQITSSICCKLATRLIAQEDGNLDIVEDFDQQVDLEMQELSQLVLQSHDADDRLTKRTFLDIVKSCCYIAHCSSETIDRHIFMVIFDNVI